tara:strand:+ start:1817 stop:2362 length:546 start_codon:yes stop_codon:yes gene_type:complete
MVAGSILPVTIYKNKLCFLFGKENELEQTAKGWSDFGGKVEKNENIFNGALREGSEELTGFLGNSSELRKLISENGGYKRLTHNTYHVHIFYLPYDEKLIKYYNLNHKFLWERMDHQYLSKTMLFEKIEIKWFSFEELKERKSEFRHFYQNIVDLFIENEKEIRSFIQSKKAKKNKTLKNN